jgi:hypothetical protein
MNNELVYMILNSSRPDDPLLTVSGRGNGCGNGKGGERH